MTLFEFLSMSDNIPLVVHVIAILVAMISSYHYWLLRFPNHWCIPSRQIVM